MQLGLAFKSLRNAGRVGSQQRVQGNGVGIDGRFSIVVAAESDAAVCVHGSLRDRRVEIEIRGVLGNMQFGFQSRN